VADAIFAVKLVEVEVERKPNRSGWEALDMLTQAIIFAIYLLSRMF
jgi:hypothetical protein